MRSIHNIAAIFALTLTLLVPVLGAAADTGIAEYRSTQELAAEPFEAYIASGDGYSVRPCHSRHFEDSQPHHYSQLVEPTTESDLDDSDDHESCLRPGGPSSNDGSRLGRADGLANTDSAIAIRGSAAPRAPPYI